MLPSGPKPTKEAYLSTLRTLKEHHQNTEEEHKLVRNSPVKTTAGKAVLCTEEVITAKPVEAKKIVTTTVLKSVNLSKAMAMKDEVKILAKEHAPPPKVPVTPALKKANKITPSTQSTKRVIQTESLKQQAKQKEKLRLGRKATRRFTVLAGMLPNFNLDKSTKLQVAETLKEMNCWSDDEPEEGMSSFAEGDDDESTDSEAEQPIKQGSKQLESAPAIAQSTNKSTKNIPAASAKVNAEDSTSSSSRAAVLANFTKAVKPAQAKPKGPHAYLEEQKELARKKAKEAMVKKAIKLYVRVRKDEVETQRKQQWAASGKYALERSIVAKVAAARWNRILSQAFPLAMDK
jgi:hypothetical protein